jgi:hypothetical protein
MQNELQQAERNRIANERQQLAKARANTLVAEFQRRRDTIVTRAEDFMSSGRGSIDDLAAALELDQTKARNRLERGATLILAPVEGFSTVTYEGRRHYRVNHVTSSPLGRLEQEFRSKQDFSWESWMSLTQSTKFERTEIDCLFDSIADLPGEVRNVDVELLSFLQGNSSTVISFSCE